MKGSNIISAIHHLRQAKDAFEDFQREHPGSKGSQLMNTYINKINWTFKDIITTPGLTAGVVAGIKREIESDVYAVDAIHEKITLLKPEQRELIELALEKILKGEELTIEIAQ